MSDKPKAAVVMDDWKIPIFRKHLKQAGYEWEEMPTAIIGPLKGTTTFQVQFYDQHTLHMVIRTCEAACSRQGKPE